MEELPAYKIVEKLRQGEKIPCNKCKKGHYDNSNELSAYYDTFYCDNPDCDGHVHVARIIKIE